MHVIAACYMHTISHRDIILLNMGFHLMQQAVVYFANVIGTKHYNLAVLRTNPNTAAGERTRTSAGAAETMWMLEARSPVDTWILPCRDRLKRKVGRAQPVRA